MEISRDVPIHEQEVTGAASVNRDASNVPRSGHLLSNTVQTVSIPSSSSSSATSAPNTVSTGTSTLIPIISASSPSTIMDGRSTTTATTTADSMAAQHYFLSRLIQARDGSGTSYQWGTPTSAHRSILYHPPPSNRIGGFEILSNSSSAQQMRPQFRSKVVCVLTCKHCESLVCKRGMKAILLADMNVELFSTDAPPFKVQLVFEDYRTKNCACRIRDVACLGCGNVIGYHVTQPCEPCMESANNGHFWMFHIAEVNYKDRTDGTGKHTMVWAQLPRADRDLANDSFDGTEMGRDAAR